MAYEQKMNNGSEKNIDFLEHIKASLAQEEKDIREKYKININDPIYKDNDKVWRFMHKPHLSLEQWKKNEQEDKENIDNLYKKDSFDPYHQN